MGLAEAEMFSAVILKKEAEIERLKALLQASESLKRGYLEEIARLTASALKVPEDIKRWHFDNLMRREVVMLVKADYGWEVRHFLATGGVAPTSSYDTPHEAAARALQLLRIKEPVAPQDKPEIAGIGAVLGDK